MVFGFKIVFFLVKVLLVFLKGSKMDFLEFYFIFLVFSGSGKVI